MYKYTLIQAIIFTMLLFPLNSALASEDEKSDTDDKQQVYGWELMTSEEMAKHREMMRSLGTEEEREEYQKEHHERMQARAAEKGITLSGTPMMRRSGQGAGRGSGKMDGSGPRASGGGKQEGSGSQK